MFKIRIVFTDDVVTEWKLVEKESYGIDEKIQSFFIHPADKTTIIYPLCHIASVTIKEE